MNKYLIILIVILLILIIIIPIKNYVDKQSGIKLENKIEEFQNKINEIKKIIQENFTVNTNECIYVTVYDTDGTLKTNPSNQDGIDAYEDMKRRVEDLVTTLENLENNINAAFVPTVSSLLQYNEGFLGTIEKVNGVLQTDATTGKYKRTTNGQVAPLLLSLNNWLGADICSDMCNSSNHEIYNYKDNRCYCEENYAYDNNYLSNCLQRYTTHTAITHAYEYLKDYFIYQDRNDNNILKFSNSTSILDSDKIIISHSTFNSRIQKNIYYFSNNFNVSSDVTINKSLKFLNSNPQPSTKRWYLNMGDNSEASSKEFKFTVNEVNYNNTRYYKIIPYLLSSQVKVFNNHITMLYNSDDPLWNDEQFDLIVYQDCLPPEFIQNPNTKLSSRKK